MAAHNQSAMNASAQLATIGSAAVVGVTQNILQASVVTKGKVETAVVNNKSAVKKGKAVNTTTVTLTFSTK